MRRGSAKQQCAGFATAELIAELLANTGDPQKSDLGLEALGIMTERLGAATLRKIYADAHWFLQQQLLSGALLPRQPRLMTALEAKLSTIEAGD